MDKKQREELRELAEISNKKEWRISSYGGGEYVKHWQIYGPSFHTDTANDHDLSDMKYVVAAQPKHILSLLDNIESEEWKPIETAPKDGTKILTFNGNGGGYNGMSGEGEIKGDIAVSCWDDDKWMLPHCCDGVSYNEPTHWKPLPAPPRAHDN